MDKVGYTYDEILEFMMEGEGRAFLGRSMYDAIRETIEEKDKEIERLKNGYCELKVKCNNGECDCTNEEYDGMIQCNMKLSLENDELRNILEKMGTNPNEILYLKNEVDELNNIIKNIKEEIESYIDITIDHLETNNEEINFELRNKCRAMREIKEELLNIIEKELKEGKE